MRRTALLALVVATACASAHTAAPEDLSTTRFAPALGVNLSAMAKTATGLYLQDVTVGTGAEVKRGQQVAVRYTGWLANGTKIDSSDGLEFRLGSADVIRGWNEGMAGMKVGGVRTLVIPPELGYGFRDTPVIPRGSVLVFRIEVRRVR